MKTTTQNPPLEIHPVLFFGATYIIAITFSILFCFAMFSFFKPGKSKFEKQETQVSVKDRQLNTTLSLTK